MRIRNLNELSDEDEFKADLVIVGGGPAGLTIASQLADLPIKIILLESGLLDESLDHDALNTLELTNLEETSDWLALRAAFHSPSIPSFDPIQQAFGVRSRGIGGAARYWGAKVALLEPSDFCSRDWVPHSGWPIDEAEVLPFVGRAERLLNLESSEEEKRRGPAFDSLGPSRFGVAPCQWRYARASGSERRTFDFRAEWLGRRQTNLFVVTNATVTRIITNEHGSQFEGLSVTSMEGRRLLVRARECVLAAGTIENARLLLASDQFSSSGIGNAYGQVGRYLMDHPGSEIGRIPWSPRLLKAPVRLQTVVERGRIVVRSLGLRLSDEVKRDERLLNAAVYGVPAVAADDPLDALRRLAVGTSRGLSGDLALVLRGLPLISKAFLVFLLRDHRVPARVRTATVERLARHFPAAFADLVQPYGAARKRSWLVLHAISEQAPDPSNRITLGDVMDETGVRRPRVEWGYGELEVRSIRRLATEVTKVFRNMGLPVPQLHPWIESDSPGDAPLIDMAHMLGTTRMSVHPRSGVVDRDCSVFGVDGLSIAGGSIFPTSGHANPTLLIVALSIRLADHLRIRLEARTR